MCEKRQICQGEIPPVLGEVFCAKVKDKKFKRGLNMTWKVLFGDFSFVFKMDKNYESFKDTKFKGGSNMTWKSLWGYFEKNTCQFMGEICPSFKTE